MAMGPGPEPPSRTPTPFIAPTSAHAKERVAGAHGRIAGVDAHPYTYLDAFRPGVSGECTLARNGGRDRILDAGEGGKEGVALCVNLVTAGLLESRPQQSPVIVEELAVRITQPLEQPRRPLDVSEEECDRSARSWRYERRTS